MGERLYRTSLRTGEYKVQRTSRRDLVYEARLHHDGKQCGFVVSDQLVKQSELVNDYPMFHDAVVPLCAYDVLLLASVHESEWQSPAYALPIYVEGDHPWQPVR